MSYQMTGAVLSDAPAEVKGNELLVLMVLAYHAREDGSGAFPSVATISAKAHISERSVQYALRSLEKRGLIVATARIEGGRGRSTVYSLTVKKGAKSPTVALATTPERVQPTAERVQLFAPEESRPNRPLDIHSNLTGGAGGRNGAEFREPTPRELRKLAKAFADEAVKVWEARARKLANPYVDASALRRVRDQAIEALRWADETAVLAAIKSHMDGKSSPVRIPEWGRLEMADRAERANQREKDAERRRREAELPDPAVTAAARQVLDGWKTRSVPA